MPRAKDLLLEIGTEEIPSDFLTGAISDLASLARQALEESRLSYSGIQTMGTPRRLVLVVKDLQEIQRPLSRQIVGPPVRVAFDGEGRPTPAAVGFARAQGVSVEEISIVAREKGDCVAVTLKEPALPTAEILPALLPRVITSLPLPKSMRWGEGNYRFLRPIRWLLALYGTRVISFESHGLKSGDRTFGHRFLSPHPVRVKGLSDYLSKLERKFVVLSQKDRQQQIWEAALLEAERVGGIPEYDEDLLATVAQLVEYPVVLCGHFDPEYLHLPREVITTPMKKHQRYFPVQNERGDLLPFFLTVSNMRAQDLGLIRSGNERVLQARLADAQFFYREDRKTPMEHWVSRLQQIIYAEQLGSLYDKTIRIQQLSRYLAQRICPERVAQAERAAYLAKADLLSFMVKEFPNLQGTMGRIYALAQGENEEVARAIEEHYLPRFSGDRLPQTTLGAIVSIADKIDSIVGCFAIGLIPSGSEDPYALRRQASGVILALLERGLRFSLSALLEEALSAIAEKTGGDSRSVREKIEGFFGQRLQGILMDQGFAPDLIEAILTAGFDDLVATKRRAEALATLRKQADFGDLIIGIKRAMNIVPPGFFGAVDPRHFQKEAEDQLWREIQNRKERITSFLGQEKFLEALQEISGLRSTVDRFFNEVMVMVDEVAVKENRLALLAEATRLLSGLADLSKLVVA